MCANSPGHFAIAMMVELPPMHRLYSPAVMDARFFCDAAYCSIIGCSGCEIESAIFSATLLIGSAKLASFSPRSFPGSLMADGIRVCREYYC
jgi:hypothetical protein